MTLAIFDLDNTLIGGDSDHAWGQFLVEKNVVDPDEFAAKNDQFYRDYQQGTLDIFAYQAFVLSVLVDREPAELAAWHAEFMAAKVQSMWLPKAEQLVSDHRERGHELMIITATNRFVTAPISARFGIDHLIATEPEMAGDRYTGRVAGVPSYQQGKVTRLQQWLQDNDADLAGSYFYSDSFNDLPLLSQVDNPVAVDPDPRLRAAAEDRGWPIISLRD